MKQEIITRQLYKYPAIPITNSSVFMSLCQFSFYDDVNMAVYKLEDHVCTQLMSHMLEVHYSDANRVYYAGDAAFHITAEPYGVINATMVDNYEKEYLLMLDDAGRAYIEDVFTFTSTPVFTPSGKKSHILDDDAIKRLDMASCIA